MGIMLYMQYSTTKATKPLSYRQMRALELWIKYGRKSKAVALREAGYSPSIVRQPREVFSSPAVREELDRRGFGFTGQYNNLSPYAKPTAVIRPTVDFSTFSKKQLQALKQKLADAPDAVYPPY